MNSEQTQAQERGREHTKASLRAKIEHPFRVIKLQFGDVKVRYRALAKNAAQVMTLFALSNPWMARKRCVPAAGELRGRKAEPACVFAVAAPAAAGPRACGFA